MNEEHFKLNFGQKNAFLIKKKHTPIPGLSQNLFSRPLITLKKKKHFCGKKMILKVRVMVHVNPLGPPSRVCAMANFRVLIHRCMF